MHAYPVVTYRQPLHMVWGTNGEIPSGVFLLYLAAIFQSAYDVFEAAKKCILKGCLLQVWDKTARPSHYKLWVSVLTG